jgi:hypothetical protein
MPELNALPVILCPETYLTQSHRSLLPPFLKPICVAQPVDLPLNPEVESASPPEGLIRLIPELPEEAFIRLKARIRELHRWILEGGDGHTLLYHHYKSQAEPVAEMTDEILAKLKNLPPNLRQSQPPWEPDFFFLALVHHLVLLKTDLAQAEQKIQEKEKDLAASLGPLEGEDLPVLEESSGPPAPESLDWSPEVGKKILKSWFTLYQMLPNPPVHLWIQNPFYSKILGESLYLPPGIKVFHLSRTELNQALGLSPAQEQKEGPSLYIYFPFPVMPLLGNFSHFW